MATGPGTFRATPLPWAGRSGHRLLAAGSAVLAAAADELAGGGTVLSLLAPTDDPRDEGLVRVTALNCACPALDHPLAVVTLSPPGDLRGLTRRELQVLGHVSAGVIDRRALGPNGFPTAGRAERALDVAERHDPGSAGLPMSRGSGPGVTSQEFLTDAERPGRSSSVTPDSDSKGSRGP